MNVEIIEGEVSVILTLTEREAKELRGILGRATTGYDLHMALRTALDIKGL